MLTNSCSCLHPYRMDTYIYVHYSDFISKLGMHGCILFILQWFFYLENLNFSCKCEKLQLLSSKGILHIFTGIWFTACCIINFVLTMMIMKMIMVQWWRVWVFQLFEHLFWKSWWMFYYSVLTPWFTPDCIFLMHSLMVITVICSSWATVVDLYANLFAPNLVCKFAIHS